MADDRLTTGTRPRPTRYVTRMPGDIVADSTTPLMKFPFTPDGLARPDLLDERVDVRPPACRSSKLILPTPAWIWPVLSERYSTLPALNSRDGRGHVAGRGDDGAGLRRRHQAARAEHLTEPATPGPSCPAWRGPRRSRASSPSGSSRPGRRRRRSRRRPPWPWRRCRPGRTRPRARVLPMPCGSGIAPRTIWSRLRRVDAEVDVDLDRLVELGPLELLEFGDRLLDRHRPGFAELLLDVLEVVAELLAAPRRDARLLFLAAGRSFGGRGPAAISRLGRGLFSGLTPASGGVPSAFSAGFSATASAVRSRRRRIRLARPLPSSSPCKPLVSGVRRVSRLQPLPPRLERRAVVNDYAYWTERTTATGSEHFRFQICD